MLQNFTSKRNGDILEELGVNSVEIRINKF